MEAIEKYFVDTIAAQKQHLLLSMLTRSQHPQTHSGVLEKDRDAGRKLKEEKVAGAKEAGQRVCIVYLYILLAWSMYRVHLYILLGHKVTRCWMECKGNSWYKNGRI